MYELIFDSKVLSSLEKLPKEIRTRIINKLLDSKINPFHYFEKLSGREEYKLRVGDYRIIADINNKEILIFILLIDHRRRIYKNFKWNNIKLNYPNFLLYFAVFSAKLKD